MSFLSWDSFMNLTGELEGDAECIPVLSNSSDMAPPVSQKKDKQVVEEDIDTDMQMSPPPIYRDTLCTFAKGEIMRWYQV